MVARVAALLPLLRRQLLAAARIRYFPMVLKRHGDFDETLYATDTGFSAQSAECAVCIFGALGKKPHVVDQNRLQDAS